MTSKPFLIRNQTTPMQPLLASVQMAPIAACSMAVPKPQAQAQTARTRTHSCPLPKLVSDMVQGPALPNPSAPVSPTRGMSDIERTLQPKRSLQETLEQLDRDMADCPYYKVQEMEGSP